MPKTDVDLNYMTHPDGRIAFRDQGEGETILFVHGTPTSSLGRIQY